jgi:hypothetical protein
MTKKQPKQDERASEQQATIDLLRENTELPAHYYEDNAKFICALYPNLTTISFENLAVGDWNQWPSTLREATQRERL